VLAKLDNSFGTERRIAAFGSTAARLMRAYATQVEVLRCLRHGGRQIVRVEHVHVNDGAQAFIGNVKSDSATESRKSWWPKGCRTPFARDGTVSFTAWHRRGRAAVISRIVTLIGTMPRIWMPGWSKNREYTLRQRFARI